jgi:hypothetical protein
MGDNEILPGNGPELIVTITAAAPHHGVIFLYSTPKPLNWRKNFQNVHKKSWDFIFFFIRHFTDPWIFQRSTPPYSIPLKPRPWNVK